MYEFVRWDVKTVSSGISWWTVKYFDEWWTSCHRYPERVPNYCTQPVRVQHQAWVNQFMKDSDQLYILDDLPIAYFGTSSKEGENNCLIKVFLCVGQVSRWSPYHILVPKESNDAHKPWIGIVKANLEQSICRSGGGVWDAFIHQFEWPFKYWVGEQLTRGDQYTGICIHKTMDVKGQTWWKLLCL